MSPGMRGSISAPARSDQSSALFSSAEGRAAIQTFSAAEKYLLSPAIHEKTPVKTGVFPADLFQLALAEKERFELSNGLWPLRDFQSRALDQTRRLLHIHDRFPCGQLKAVEAFFRQRKIFYHTRQAKSILFPQFKEKYKAPTIIVQKCNTFSQIRYGKKRHFALYYEW